MSTKSSAAKADKRSIALCWFRRESFEHDRAMMADPDRLYANFDTWLREAKKFEAEMAAQNVETRRIRFHGPAFLLFCSNRKIVPDSGARALWAAQEAARK